MRSIQVETAPIELVISTGDALKIRADLALVGSGPSIVNRVREGMRPRRRSLASENLFSDLDESADHLRKVQAYSRPRFFPRFPWKHAIVLSSNSGSHVRRSFHLQMSSALLVSVSYFKPDCVLFVPYHHRKPNLVAATILLHIWCYCAWYDNWALRIHSGTLPSHRPKRFHLVDRSDSSPFLETLSQDMRRLREFTARELPRFWMLASELNLDAFPPISVVHKSPAA